MPARLHLHLRTTDLAAARGFYTALLGAPDKVRDDLVRYQPEDLALSLTLMPGEPTTRGPIEHFGIKWDTPAATVAAWDRIEAAGLSVAHTEEKVDCCAAVQDKRWYVDPDGRAWEVYVVLDDQVAEPSFLQAAKTAGATQTTGLGGCCGQELAAPVVEEAKAGASGCCG